MKIVRIFLRIFFKIIFLPFSAAWWLLKSSISFSKSNLSDFLAVPPVITGMPGDIEVKKMVRTKTGWRVHYGKKGQPNSQASVMLTPATTGFSIGGGSARVNGK